MQCIPINYFGPLSTARQETPPPNPGGPESREIRRVCWSYRPEIWQATLQSCCRDARPTSEWLEKSKARISQPRDPAKSRGGTTARPAEKGPGVLRVEMSANANLPLAQTPPPTWIDARNTMLPVQFTMFNHLLPYPSGRVAAHHNRAGIGPTLVASDRRRSGTGPPRQVHRIRALVYVYYTTIQIYKYKIIQKKYSNEDEAVTAHLARQPATNPPGHTLVPPKSVYLGESKVRPIHCRELSCIPGSHDGNPKRPKRRRAGHRECTPPPPPPLHWTLEMYNSLLLIAVTKDKNSSWQ